jgi:hypothetical protein
MTKIHSHSSLAIKGGPALFLLAILSGAMLTLPALASDITVGSPLNGTKV